MRTPLLLLAASLLASTSSAQRPRTVIVVPGQITEVITDTMGTSFETPFSAARVYHALLAVYAELKIPLAVNDSVGFQVGSATFFRRSDFGGRQISTYLSCGDGITGPYADFYRVYMVLTSTVIPAGPDRSVLRTLYLAGAVNVAEGARQPMPCESTGRLEIRINQMVMKKAAGL